MNIVKFFKIVGCGDLGLAVLHSRMVLSLVFIRLPASHDKHIKYAPAPTTSDRYSLTRIN
jgi:hypothetical protein